MPCAVVIMAGVGAQSGCSGHGGIMSRRRQLQCVLAVVILGAVRFWVFVTMAMDRELGEICQQE